MAIGEILLLVFVFVIAGFLGVELISKVPSQLHTPLMSGTNAISGITIVGAISATAVALHTDGMRQRWAVPTPAASAADIRRIPEMWSSTVERSRRSVVMPVQADGRIVPSTMAISEAASS